MQIIQLPKIDGPASEGGTPQPADEMTSFFTEAINVIEGTDQVLSGSDNNQVGKGVATYAGNGDYYIDSGTANTYVLAPVGLKQAPPAYKEGQRVRFKAANTNNGPSTVNVNGVGTKDILLPDEEPIPAGTIIADQYSEMIYSETPSHFTIVTHPTNHVAGLMVAELTANQTILNGLTTKVSFTAIQDTFSIYNAIDSRIEPDVTGWYDIYINLLLSRLIDETPTLSGITFSVYKNGVFFICLSSGSTGAAADSTSMCAGSCQVKAAEGDYFEIFITAGVDAEGSILKNDILITGGTISFLQVKYLGK